MFPTGVISWHMNLSDKLPLESPAILETLRKKKKKGKTSVPA